jgi:hypothetical protein
MPAITKRAGFEKAATSEDTVRVLLPLARTRTHGHTDTKNSPTSPPCSPFFPFSPLARFFRAQTELSPCEGWLKKLSQKGSWQSRYFAVSRSARLALLRVPSVCALVRSLLRALTATRPLLPAARPPRR